MKMGKEDEEKQGMVAEFGKRAAKEEEGRTVMVGVRMDSQSRELLTWALVKVAAPGDRVIALHVLPSSSIEVSEKNGKCSSLISLVKSFDSVLAVYEGFCNLKQIDLKLKICRGSSIRKALIREAKAYSATKLILGVAKNPSILGSSWISIAKHCAKKLPLECSVLAVNNGKVVYQREALPASQCQEKNKADNKNKSGRNSSAPERKEERSLALVPMKKSLEMRPGWSLLRRAIMNDRKTSTEKSKISVFQWAMWLPSRWSFSSSIHPDRKPTNPELDPSVNCNEENNVDEDEVKILEELQSLQVKYSSICRLFSYQDLMDATSNFSTENLVGKGGSSMVYKGCLSDGRELAVKILKPSEDALKEFTSEIEIITSLNHKNIISLLGFCFENNNLVLVYDFLSRGSLEECLHGEQESKIGLKWIDRYKVAVGIAEALDYLHGSGNAQPAIHRDVKSSNILLTSDFEPQLSDFGLAKWATASTSSIACRDVAGTFGYLAPEYFMYGKVTEKIDVYAFGVVLLELLSGKKPINTGCSKDQESLVMWAKKILQEGKAKQLVDGSLGDDYDSDQMDRMILAATLCIQRAPHSRPRISIVLKLLQGDDDVLKWARSQVSASECSDDLDEVTNPTPDIQSYINLALQDIDEDSHSVSSTEPSVDFITGNTSLEDYLQGRWSRSSSFD
ncbi:probable receptor-like serine/threonine-protein kinase At5g57670 [Dioscorea cayenensis subsp. rotundata]|uniref:Probable receptor-like serine/threonine-protein kinase At5g57670 n=1 Tax=Dioscorea cayennensis subsp. rotundata TaxID=55577 RepID=A0AB40AQ93_DIOCR|nr:probable receptor-like serine/threonine-protein kinase At5g57670 [Dioscorea cayenensis subsp. rotundata]